MNKKHKDMILTALTEEFMSEYKIDILEAASILKTIIADDKYKRFYFVKFVVNRYIFED